MAKTVIFDVDAASGRISVYSGSLFLGEQAPIEFTGYPLETGHSLFLTVFANDRVTPIADNSTSADILDLRYDAMRRQFDGVLAANAFPVILNEKDEDGNFVGQVIAHGSVIVKWSPMVFDAVTGSPATMRGIKGDDGADLTWTSMSSAERQALVNALAANDDCKGAKGDKGDKGDQGVQGAQGVQGVQGEKGDKGDKGTDGRNGTNGRDGDKGDRGDDLTWQTMTDDDKQALVDLLAADGRFKGEKGDQGIQGIQGIQGGQGIQGEQGIQGKTGNASSAMVGNSMSANPTQRELTAVVKLIFASMGGTIQ